MSAVLSADTIAAVATPAGRGGVGIIRISGPAAAQIATQVAGHLPAPRQAQLSNFRDHQDQLIDQGLVLYFAGPHSFTGEDVVELQGHGGPVVMDMLLARVVELGARIAGPGEFSQRAFLNDKLDLAQAEAIADLIDSGSQRAAQCAANSLQGAFSERIQTLGEQILRLRMYVEAAIDFPDEDIDFLADDHIAEGVVEIAATLDRILSEASQGAMLREGITLVFAGEPNAGKSSLMNVFSGRESSIVTEIAGTTRDLVQEHIELDGIPLKLIDTAGLRETEDVVEREGVRRARLALAEADIALLVIDHAANATDWQALAQRLSQQTPSSANHLVVLNKLDLAPLTETEIAGSEPDGFSIPVVGVSVKTGEGLVELKQKVQQLIGYDSSIEGNFIARRRHLDALGRAQSAVLQGQQHLQDQAGDLLAEELRLAHQALGEITGTVTSDELLDEIFSRFCIGK